MGDTYFDFSDLAETIDNATNEAGSSIESDAPTWLKIILIFAIFGAIILVVTKFGHTMSGWFDMTKWGVGGRKGG